MQYALFLNFVQLLIVLYSDLLFCAVMNCSEILCSYVLCTTVCTNLLYVSSLEQVELFCAIYLVKFIRLVMMGRDICVFSKS